MRPTKIFILRHAESEEDVDNSVYAHTSDLDIGLSSKGVLDAFLLGNQLINKITSQEVWFYISPGLRLKQTYEILTTKFPPSVSHTAIVDNAIVKQNWGDVTVENRREVEIARYKEGVLKYRFPNGESGLELVERLKSFIEKLKTHFLENTFPGNIVIITHGFVMRVLLMLWFNWNESYFEKLANPRNCEIATLALKGDTYILEEELRRYNSNSNPNHTERVA